MKRNSSISFKSEANITVFFCYWTFLGHIGHLSAFCYCWTLNALYLPKLGRSGLASLPWRLWLTQGVLSPPALPSCCAKGKKAGAYFYWKLVRYYKGVVFQEAWVLCFKWLAFLQEIILANNTTVPKKSLADEVLTSSLWGEAYFLHLIAWKQQRYTEKPLGKHIWVDLPFECLRYDYVKTLKIRGFCKSLAWDELLKHMFKLIFLFSLVFVRHSYGRPHL